MGAGHGEGSGCLGCQGRNGAMGGCPPPAAPHRRKPPNLGLLSPQEGSGRAWGVWVRGDLGGSGWRWGARGSGWRWGARGGSGRAGSGGCSRRGAGAGSGTPACTSPPRTRSGRTRPGLSSTGDPAGTEGQARGRHRAPSAPHPRWCHREGWGGELGVVPDHPGRGRHRDHGHMEGTLVTGGTPWLDLGQRDHSHMLGAMAMAVAAWLCGEARGHHGHTRGSCGHV